MVSVRRVVVPVLLLVAAIPAFGAAKKSSSRPPRELHRVGDHWTAGERLVDLVVRIGEMLAYQAYNIRSPLDARAAMWADLNPDKLPTDPKTIRPAELG